MRIGTIWGLIGFLALATGLAAWEQDAAKPSTDEVAALKTEVARLRGLVPDQSHAMADVGYHFTNLWFAGEQSNWPLAQFYSDEVRSSPPGTVSMTRSSILPGCGSFPSGSTISTIRSLAPGFIAFRQWPRIVRH